MELKGKIMYIWQASKKRQISHLNYFFSKRNVSIDKFFYRVIRKIFQSDSGIRLDDLEKTARRRLITKLFYFKFESSCSNAKYVRCEKKKGYENVKFLLGDWKSIIRNLNKYRPDLVETGISICEKYIRNGFDKDYAPVVHRKADSGHYVWDNIEILTRKEHDELTKAERQRKRQAV